MEESQRERTSDEDMAKTPLSSSDERTASVAISPSQVLSRGVSESTAYMHEDRLANVTSSTATVPTRPGQMCSHCSTTISPLWRRTDRGEIVCNACGLYYKNRGHKRPIELKMAGVRRKKKLAMGGPMPVTGKPLKRRKIDEAIEGDSAKMDLMNRRRKTMNPLRPSRLPLTSLGDILTGFQQTKFQGQYYYTGDVVIVRGDDGKDYFLVVSGFSVIGAEKYFQCFWLVPKASSFLEAQQHRRSLTPFDYELFAAQEYRLPMSVIKGVAYSPTEMFVPEQELGRDPTGLLHDSIEKASYVANDEKEAADALLLVRFANADGTTSRAF
jgi:hypothetical protein